MILWLELGTHVLLSSGKNLGLGVGLPWTSVRRVRGHKLYHIHCRFVNLLNKFPLHESIFKKTPVPNLNKDAICGLEAALTGSLKTWGRMLLLDK